MSNRPKRRLLPALALAVAGLVLTAAAADAAERHGRRGAGAYAERGFDRGHAGPRQRFARPARRAHGDARRGHYRRHVPPRWAPAYGYRYGHRRGWYRGHRHRPYYRSRDSRFPLGFLLGAAVVGATIASHADPVEPAYTTVDVSGGDGGAPELAAPERYCREYQTTVVVNGAQQSAYGTACRQPDGSWQRQ